jgi:uncharacterized protein involved in exopolysaccharide biosynthesis
MNHFIDSKDIDIKSIYRIIVNNIASITKFTIFVAISSIIISLFLPPKFETNSVILPYQNSQQSSGVSGLLQNSLGLASQSMNYSRIFDDLFTSYDFIGNILNKNIEDKEGNKSLLIDLIIDKELNGELTDNQLQLLAQSIFISQNLSMNYDPYKSLMNLRITFNDDVLALNIHNLILEEFDTYLSDLKNTKIQQKNTKLIQKLSSVNEELNELERKREHFINNNKNINESAYLLKELGMIQREIGVKESIYLTISSQVELNKIDLSIEKNNFRILNRPVLPLNPSFPRKKLIVIFSTIFALIISSLYYTIRVRA